MDLYMLAEHDDLSDFSDALYSDIQKWCAAKPSMRAVYRRKGGTEAPLSTREIEVGIEFSANKTQKLKDPLNFLNGLTNTYKCDFVVGVIDEVPRDVCYFGYEEGRPDMYEFANYLGL